MLLLLVFSAPSKMSDNLIASSLIVIVWDLYGM